MAKNIPLYGGFPLVDATVRGAQGKAAVGLVTSGNWQADLPNATNKEFTQSYRTVV